MDGQLSIYGWQPHNLNQQQGDLARSDKPSSSLRWHPFRQEWSVYAGHRQTRTFKPAISVDPLAPMQQGGTSTEIPFEDFELAIFDNQFPSLSASSKQPDQTIPSVLQATAFGHCEVVVYSPKAEGSLATISQARRELLVYAWKDKYIQHYKAGHAYILPFENRGDEVGVTLSHPHGQIYAFPFVPEPQKKAVQTFQKGFDLASRIEHWWCDYGIRQAGTVSAFAPPFARFPFETWIAPKKRRSQLTEFSSEEVSDFAFLLGDIAARYDAYFGQDCPFMLTLHAAPNPAHLDVEKQFHFTAQFYPLLRAPGRQKYLAGVEQATGVFTVDVLPEQTASLLRKVL